MATINEPTNINNNTANSGAGLETRLETLWQNDQALNAELETKANVATLDERTEIQTGTGFAPSGTPVKMSYFEGTTNASGFLQFAHGLGANIIMVLAANNPSGNRYIVNEFSNKLGTDTARPALLDFDNTNITFLVGDGNIAAPQPVRFLVWHK